MKHETITEIDVLQRFPALHELLTIYPSAWHFAETDFDGEPATVGHCHWSTHIDALGIFDEHQCIAVRIRDDLPGRPGGLVWQYEGGLRSAVDELLALPTPSSGALPQPGRACSMVWPPR